MNDTPNLAVPALEITQLLKGHDPVAMSPVAFVLEYSLANSP